MRFGIITRREVAITAAGLFLRSAASPKTSRERVKLLRVPNNGIQPQLIAAPRGPLHLVYYSGDPRAGDIYYVRSSDAAGTWSAPLKVNDSGSAIAAGTIRGAQIALGKNDRVHVAWNGSGKAQPRGPLNPDSGEAGQPMLYSRLNDVATAFEPQRNLMTHSFGLDGGGSVAADSAGNVYVAWHGIGQDEAKGELQGEARRRVWIAKSDDDGQSFSREHSAWRERTGACGCCGMKVFADHRGDLLAMYRSAQQSVHRDVYLLRSTDKGNTFTGKLLHKWEINACPMSSMDFAGNNRNVIAAWETGGQVYWDRVASPAPEPVAAPGEGKGRKHPRLAMNKNGELLLVWTEGTGWQRGGSIAWQHYDAAGKPTTEHGTAAGLPPWSFPAAAASLDGTFTILY